MFCSGLCCRAELPRVVAAWLRCYVMVNVVYFLTGGMWAYYVYVCWGDKFFAPGNMPALKDMFEQIKVSTLCLRSLVMRNPAHLAACLSVRLSVYVLVCLSVLVMLSLFFTHGQCLFVSYPCLSVQMSMLYVVVYCLCPCSCACVCTSVSLHHVCVCPCRCPCCQCRCIACCQQ